MLKIEELQGIYNSFPKEVFDSIYSEIKRNFYDEDKLNSLPNPTAIILGGQPGSGKSQLELITKLDFKNNIASVSADDFREMHPLFDSIVKQYPQEAPLIVNPFASSVAEKLIKDFTDKKYNILIESTMGNLPIVENTIDNFKKSNYQVGLKILAVHPKLSLLGTALRYENMVKAKGWGRAVPKLQHDIRFDALVKNVSTLCKSGKMDKIEIFSRNMNLNKDGDWDYLPKLVSNSKETAVKYLSENHQRPFSFKENLYIAERAAIILKMMQERHATMKEISEFRKNFGLSSGRKI